LAADDIHLERGAAARKGDLAAIVAGHQVVPRNLPLAVGVALEGVAELLSSERAIDREPLRVPESELRPRERRPGSAIERLARTERDGGRLLFVSESGSGAAFDPRRGRRYTGTVPR